LRTSLGELAARRRAPHAAAAATAASEKALARAGANVAEEADVSSGNGAAISSSAGALTAAATRIAGELKTLDTYLTTTPASQLDPGYVASQAAYLAQQLSGYRETPAPSATRSPSFEATLRTLNRDAQALKTH